MTAERLEARVLAGQGYAVVADLCLAGLQQGVRDFAVWWELVLYDRRGDMDLYTGTLARAARQMQENRRESGYAIELTPAERVMEAATIGYCLRDQLDALGPEWRPTWQDGGGAR